MKRSIEGERCKTRPDLEARLSSPSPPGGQRDRRKTEAHEQGHAPPFQSAVSCLSWQQSIRRGGAIMNPNCSLFTTLQGVSMQICPERYLVYARPTI